MQAEAQMMVLPGASTVRCAKAGDTASYLGDAGGLACADEAGRHRARHPSDDVPYHSGTLFWLVAGQALSLAVCITAGTQRWPELDVLKLKRQKVVESLFAPFWTLQAAEAPLFGYLQ